jgi:DNA transformation protein
MFSGAGVFADGLMIALVVDGVIFLKADETLVPQFEREGLTPFSYKTKDGRRTLMSYWRMPERFYDDPDELADWARQSMAAAQRSAIRAKRTATQVSVQVSTCDDACPASPQAAVARRPVIRRP